MASDPLTAVSHRWRAGDRRFRSLLSSAETTFQNIGQPGGPISEPSRRGSYASTAPSSLPAGIQEPRGRRRDRPVFRRRTRRGSESAAPAVEIRSGRAEVPPDLATMFGSVAEDVDERIAHFARSREIVRVVAVGPNTAAAPQELIEPSRHANGKSLHSLREAPAVVGLDQQVNVVGLDAEMGDAQKPPARGANLSEHAAENRLRPQGGQSGTDANCHVHWMAPVMGGPSQVRNAGAFTLGLATSAPSPAPRARKRRTRGCLEREGKLKGLPHVSEFSAHYYCRQSAEDSPRKMERFRSLARRAVRRRARREISSVV
jgi:hypothetical protein